MTVDVQPLAEDLWRVPTSASNAYLWRTRAGGFVVVDPGLYGDETIVQDALRSLGASTGDVQSIIVTHFHSDHAGAAAALAAATGAAIGASFRDAAVLRGDAPRPLPDLAETERPLYEQIAAAHPANMAAPRCSVTLELEHGDPIDADEDMIVHAVTGHTWGSIALHLPRRAAVLTGDIAIGGYDGRPAPGPFNVDRTRARRALGRLAALQPRIAGLGHGAPLLDDAQQVLTGLAV